MANPLEMNDIIPKILDYLPVKDLEICRHVSQTWNAEACLILRKKKTVVFHRADSVKPYIKKLLASSKPPHTQFDFHFDDTRSSVVMKNRGLSEFFTLCGPYVRSLGFHIATQGSVFWPDLGEILALKMPNLETLVLPGLLPRQLPNRPKVDTRVYQNRSIKTLRIQLLHDEKARNVERLTDILKALPNLQVIDVLDNEIASLESNVLSKVLRKSEVSLPRLRRINTNLTLNQEGLSALVNKRMPLQQLHITLEDGVESFSFKSLISPLGSTLSELKVTFPNHYAENPENLEEHPEECISRLSKLGSLHLVNFKWPIEFVTKLPTSFPYLRCLRVHEIDDERLRVIYQSLPLLSELELSNANCTDWGLTGISLQICNDMVETCSFYLGAEKHRTDLYIGSLPFLRSITVLGPLITDVSVALGLAECRNMMELKVGSSLISNMGIIFLVNRLGRQLNSLDVSECTELTDDTKSYATEMTRGTVKTSNSTNRSIDRSTMLDPTLRLRILRSRLRHKYRDWLA